jgi:hypothetical protein
VIKVLETINRRRADTRTARFLGMEASGKLDLPYLERSLSRLGAGEIYELMCHPGEFDAQEVTDARLLRYHDWQGELSALTTLPLAGCAPRESSAAPGRQRRSTRGPTRNRPAVALALR